jgi:hypothetical protein
MSGFSSEWLALREPFDARARNAQVLDAVLAAFADRPSVTIVDLACGTGSTLRALAPRIAARQFWRLVDNDLGLLLRASASAHPARASITTLPLDLTRDLEAALDGAVNLVTASALLDLVSAEWLERLAVEAAVRAIPIYAALSYDGRIDLAPSDPGDVAIVTAVNAHQRSDKGFGVALGPSAAAAAVARFEALGYSVMQGAADWVIRSGDREMQLQLLAGWAGAAREIGAVSLAEAAGWLTRRRDAVAAGRSSMRIGHVDAFARPTQTRQADKSQSSSRSLPS